MDIPVKPTPGVPAAATSPKRPQPASEQPAPVKAAPPVEAVQVVDLEGIQETIAEQVSRRREDAVAIKKVEPGQGI